MEGGSEEGREQRSEGDEQLFYVMAIMDWVHMAWTWFIIGNRSEAG